MHEVPLSTHSRFFAFLIVLLFATACGQGTAPPSPEQAATPVVENPTAPPTPIPTQIPTATLAPAGEIQANPGGYVYLGDPADVALGFNMNAGGAIGSLRYHGTEMVDDTDFGRYIQFSPYDGSGVYGCNATSCFVNWDWNPLQAGGADGVAAQVQEYRRWADGLYVKAPGHEWGLGGRVSDVTYETWAWDRGGYFEVHTRMTHTGTDTHTTADAEAPAAYFGAAIPLEYGYTGDAPFTADAMQTYNLLTANMGENPHTSLFAAEHWLAFGNSQQVGLILALPPQRRLTDRWSMVFIQLAYPHPIGYVSPFANLLTTPGAVFDLTYYLIPGPIAAGRAIVYNLVPHVSWTFDLDTNEGWARSGQAAAVSGGILTAELSGGSDLTSMPGLGLYGIHSPEVDMLARTQSGSADVCLQFITVADWIWNTEKSSCVLVDPGEFRSYRFDFSTDPAWTDGLVTQLRLTSPGEVTLEIDRLIAARRSFGWEFGDPNDVDGWSLLNQLMPLQNRDGSLFSTSTGDDPYMVSPYVGIDAAAFNRIEIRMKTSGGSDGDVFFITDRDPDWGADKVKRFSLTSDGTWHVYTLDLSSVAGWSGHILQIRLDPMSVAGDFAVDYVRVLPP
jgi:hypothetical protein